MELLNLNSIFCLYVQSPLHPTMTKRKQDNNSGSVISQQPIGAIIWKWSQGPILSVWEAPAIISASLLCFNPLLVRLVLHFQMQRSASLITKMKALKYIFTCTRFYIPFNILIPATFDLENLSKKKTSNCSIQHGKHCRKPSKSNKSRICNTWLVGRAVCLQLQVEPCTAALCFFSRGTVSKPFLPLCPKPVYNSLSPPQYLPQVVKCE